MGLTKKAAKMSDQFDAELQKLSEHFKIPLADIVFFGSANARFIAAGEFLAAVNKKLGPAPKEKKAKKE